MGVGKVDCFQIPGCELWFNSADHLPPHLHLEHLQEGWEIKVKFLRDEPDDIEVVRGVGPRAKLLKEIRKEVRAHRDDLLREWEDKVNVVVPGPAR